MYNKVVCVALNPSVDVTLEVDTISENIPNLVKRELKDAGGKGVNVAKLLTNFKVPNKLLGILGEDNHDTFLKELNDLGVKYDFVTFPGMVRVNVTVVSGDHRELKFNKKGDPVTRADLRRLAEELLEVVGPDCLVVFAGSLPVGLQPEDFIKLVQQVQKKTEYIALNVSFLNVEETMALRPFIIRPSRYELQNMVGAPLERLEDVIYWSKRLHAAGINHVLTSLGEEGFLYINTHHCVRVSVPKLEVKTSVGAGDALLAGFIYGQVRQLREEDCLRCAAAFASVSVTLAGSRVVSKENAPMLREVIDQIKVTEIGEDGQTAADL